MEMRNTIYTTLQIWWAQLQELGLLKVLLWIGSDAVRCVIGAPLRLVSQLTPQLHLGGQYRKRGWPKLAKRGITAVVNLRAEFDDNSTGIAPQRYLYLPTIDNETPTLEQLREGVAFIAKEIARGGRVYVHCHSGTGRAATMTAAYLTSTGLSPEKAWAFIRETRPFVCPTSAQAVQVELFARSVLDKPVHKAARETAQ